MRVFAKALIDAQWGDVTYCIFREGEFQNPIAMLSESDVLLLRDELRNAVDEAHAYVTARRTASRNSNA